MEQAKYYIHLYDYEEGSAIFESDFYNSIEEALEFAKGCNFKVSENINVELMYANFYDDECDYVEFYRSLEPFEYGRI